MGSFLRLANGVPRSFAESGNPSIYDQGVDVASPITAGTSVTLPAAQTYDSKELEVYLNGTRLENLLDYTYVGSPPRTQIQFTFDLVIGDHYRFRIDRVA